MELIQRVHASFMQYLSTTNAYLVFSTNLPLLLAPIKKTKTWSSIGMLVSDQWKKKKWNGWNTIENDFNNGALEKEGVHLVCWCKYTCVDQITAGLYETEYFHFRWSTFWSKEKWRKWKIKHDLKIEFRVLPVSSVHICLGSFPLRTLLKDGWLWVHYILNTENSVSLLYLHPLSDWFLK